MTDPKLIIVEAQMLIRKPASYVFNAFIDPSITKNFWFTKGSDILEVGKKVTWEWEMYGVSWTVSAKEIVKDKKIVLDESPAPTTIEFHFKQLSEITTYVTIKQYGFDETGY
ncbi:MAG: SRPBCC domain-containing protein [Saprospiraceae bacterium]